jgi:uncharacterized damage-inducible protein DinB
LRYASVPEDAVDLRAHHRRLLAWDAWANREAIASLRAAATPPPRALRFMCHVPAAERLWLGRLRQDPAPVVVWPELTLDQCAAEAESVAGDWPRLLDGPPPADLERKVAYRNSLGESWTSTVGDILTHVVAHSAYHRGQVASELRAAGFTPAYTDFIHAVRQGRLPS